MTGVGPAATFFVAPVGGYAIFGTAVHLMGPHLDLDGLTVEPDDRGVE